MNMSLPNFGHYFCFRIFFGIFSCVIHLICFHFYSRWKNNLSPLYRNIKTYIFSVGSQEMGSFYRKFFTSVSEKSLYSFSFLISWPSRCDVLCNFLQEVLLSFTMVYICFFDSRDLYWLVYQFMFLKRINLKNFSIIWQIYFEYVCSFYILVLPCFRSSALYFHTTTF